MRAARLLWLKATGRIAKMYPAKLLRSARVVRYFIREHRKHLGLDQAELAKRIGVIRQWVISVERRARAELGLVLRAIDALGLQLQAYLPQARASVFSKKMPASEKPSAAPSRSLRLPV